MHFIWKELAGFIFPPRCPVCDEPLLPGRMVCPACSRALPRVKEPACKRCGKPLGEERREYCSDCSRAGHVYRQGKAVFVYRGGIRKSLYRFKYAGRREYASFYAHEAAMLYRRWIAEMGIEVIVPVPMYPAKKRRRGYNQAEAFACALGRELGLPVESMVLRVRETVPQKELNDRQRRLNLKNAFQFAYNIVEYKRVLLVDDIYTTGSTMDAVSHVLLSAGVKHIYFICISVGAGF